MARLFDWAWDRYEYLTDPQRVALGVALSLVLAASALYLLGAASLLALQRAPELEAVEAAAPAVVEDPLPGLPPAPEVDPISPLLADITPTPRPTFTPRPTSTATASPTITPTRPRVAGTPTRPGAAAPGRPLASPTVAGVRPNAAVPSASQRGVVVTSTPTTAAARAAR